MGCSMTGKRSRGVSRLKAKGKVLKNNSIRKYLRNPAGDDMGSLASPPAESTTLAKAIFSRPDLLTNPNGLTQEDCKDLYLDMRRFYDARITDDSDESNQKSILKMYMPSGSNDDSRSSVTERRIIMRTSLLIGCVLVRELDDEIRGDSFPSRDNKSKYPENYRYRVLDMYLSKQFNNDRAKRTRGGAKIALQHMYAYSPQVLSRVKRQNLDGTEDLRISPKRLVVFSSPSGQYVIHCSTVARKEVKYISRVILVHLMYAQIQGFVLLSFYELDEKCLQESRDISLTSTIQQPGARTWVSDIQESEWIQKWRKDLKVSNHCSSCRQERENYRFHTLVFDICNGCFASLLHRFRDYINNHGEPYNFENIVRELFPGLRQAENEYVR